MSTEKNMETTTKSMYYPMFRKNGKGFHVANSMYYFSESDCKGSLDWLTAEKKGEAYVKVREGQFDHDGNFIDFIN